MRRSKVGGDQVRAHRKADAEIRATEIDGGDISEAPQKVEEIGDRTSRYELEGDWRGNELT
jgi:hypothetical protein